MAGSATTPTEISIPGLGGEIQALAWGDPSHPKALCLHGWLDNAATFSGLAPLLGSHYLIAPDLPGHGRSHPLPGYRIGHFSDWVPEIEAIRKALEWERLTLIGHSMGAGIAMLMAATFPERVDKLVFLDGISPLPLDAEEAPQRLHTSTKLLLAKQFHQKRVFDSIEEIIEVRQKVGKLSKSSAQTLVHRGIRKTDQGYEWSSDHKLTLPTLMRFTPELINAFIAKVQCPALILKSDQGLLKKAPLFDKFASHLKNGTTVEITGGHHVHLDDPEPVAKAINDFL